jgi:hypothetical protein
MCYKIDTQQHYQSRVKTCIPAKDETTKSHRENKPRKHEKIKIMFALN